MSNSRPTRRSGWRRHGRSSSGRSSGTTWVYGLTTGVGVRKRVRVPRRARRLNRRLILNHLVATALDASVVAPRRCRLANGFALGVSGVRPIRGSPAEEGGRAGRGNDIGLLGQADLASMGDLAHGLLRGEAPAAKEGIAFSNNNLFSTGMAAVADARRLLLTVDVAGALDLEAFAANLTPLHERVAEVRPYRGLRDALERLRSLLEGSRLWEEGAARNLQDPLVFRCLPQVQGAGLDALRFAESQLAVELNAAQEKSAVTIEDRVVSVATSTPCCSANRARLLRIVLALFNGEPAPREALEFPLSGLPEGLAVERGLAADSLAELGVVGQALVAEARLLAQPASRLRWRAPRTPRASKTG